jgi:hypothetical protein
MKGTPIKPFVNFRMNVSNGIPGCTIVAGLVDGRPKHLFLYPEPEGIETHR